jgi:hypothetical protein
MIAAHDADADDTDTQRTLSACYCSLHHISMVSPRPGIKASHPLAWDRPAGDYSPKAEVNTF